jgi:hypothetical protein
MEQDKEKLVRFTLLVEEEVLEALEEAAKEYTEETGKKWSKAAVARLALSEFFTRRGRLI